MIQRQITRMELRKLKRSVRPEDIETDPDLSCFLCKKVKREIVYFPCKHFLACQVCDKKVLMEAGDKKKCILCGETVELR